MLPHFRKQEELEARFIEEETQRRIDELVAERVAAEIQKRKSEIEEEVLKRVEEAKRVMERQLVEEMERKQKQQEEEEERKKVSAKFNSFHTKQLTFFCSSSLVIKSELLCDLSSFVSSIDNLLFKWAFKMYFSFLCGGSLPKLLFVKAALQKIDFFATWNLF